MHSPVPISNPRRNLKIIVSSPTLRTCVSDQSFRSPYMCLSPILSPRQLETRSKLLNSPSASTQRIQYLDFKQKVNKLITRRLELQIRKKETYGIFPKELNDLRQETLKEVSLHRE